MNDTLKAAGRIGAELGAAKAENERLRGLLREVRVLLANSSYKISGTAAFLSSIDNALSRQAEPVRCPGTEDAASMDSDSAQEQYTAVDMAKAAAQGFRDWHKAAPAPAQDERDAFEAHMRMGGYGNPEKHQDGSYVSSAMELWWQGWKARAARPAQTEQQPAYVECRECTDCGHVGINDAHPTDATCAMCDWSGPSPVEDQCPDCGKENAMGAACPKCSGRYRILAETHVAAPIAQTAPQGKFRMGDLVKKSTGSEWVGRVVGWYSTEQTKEGYAVESSAHRNSVQIYPVTALEAVE